MRALPLAFCPLLGGVGGIVGGVLAGGNDDQQARVGVRGGGGISYDLLPDETQFPGPWEKYIKAPEDKTRIEPARVWRTSGNVTVSATTTTSGGGNPGTAVVSVGEGGEVTWEFAENIAGRVCWELQGVRGSTGAAAKGVNVSFGYSESSWFAGREPDATGDRIARDLPLVVEVGGEGGGGKGCVPREFVRGGFKYLTLVVVEEKEEEEDEQEEQEELIRGRDGKKEAGWWEGFSQRVLGGMNDDDEGVNGNGDKKEKEKKEKPWVSVGKIWVNCTAFPSQKNGRAYSGYFYSSSEMLNRVWYAGAWTLQLSTIDPKEGGALIDYNRAVDGNQSPTGSWYSNFTISNGTAVTTDGAKRDRMVWPGDMFLAIPGIAISTYDLAAVRNALDVLYDFQYPDGSLPYAGPPMGYHGEFSDTYHMHTLLGTYWYVLYSGDLDWLRARWDSYLRALSVSTAKVDEYDLLHVSSTADWLRPGMTGHNGEATAILHTVLSKSLTLDSWLGRVSPAATTAAWTALQSRLATGLARLYCPASGLYSDNIGRRSCLGSESCTPQDGNSWALISGIDLTPSQYPFDSPKSQNRSGVPLPSGPPTAKNISDNLRSRWTRHGAPAVEFPNVISPFASGFELLAHLAAGQTSHAVELALIEWGYLLEGDGFTNSTLAEGFRIDGDVQYPAYWSTARNSHAHGWSSGPTTALTSGVLGIELTEPAGRMWKVKPDLTEFLAWARGGFTTSFGRFEVLVWRIRCVRNGTGTVTGTGTGTGWAVEVRVPEGTSGVVQMGVDQEEKVTGGQEQQLFYILDGGGDYDQAEDGLPERNKMTRVDIGQKKNKTNKKEEEQDEKQDEKEDWYKSIVIDLGGGKELVFDDKWEAKAVEERKVGVVDWAVMERHFKTEPPAGWSVESLKKKEKNENNKDKGGQVRWNTE